MRMAGPRSVLEPVLSAMLSALVLAAGIAGAAGVAGETSLRERLAAASPERGEKVFRVCRACHTIGAGAPHTLGPNLWAWSAVPWPRPKDSTDIRRPCRRSEESGLRSAWYLRQPAAEVRGTAMVFPGIPDAGDRADLIAWLNRNSPAPADTGPERAAGRGAVTAVGGETSAPRSVRPPELGVLVNEEGAEETHAYCTACHSERIVAQQGLTRADWEEVLEQMVEENGMDPVEEPDLGRILAYLATHYGPGRPNFPNP